MLSFHVAVFVRFANDSADIADYVGPLWPKSITFALVMIFSMIALGLYDRASWSWEGRSAMILRVLATFLFAIFPLSFIFFVAPDLSVWRGPALLSFLISLVGIIGLADIRSELGRHHHCAPDLLQDRGPQGIQTARAGSRRRQ